jgi:hypothetical protein
MLLDDMMMSVQVSYLGWLVGWFPMAYTWVHLTHIFSGIIFQSIFFFFQIFFFITMKECNLTGYNINPQEEGS